ncbi:hypothetical protein VTN02DRAFT_2849 [Thermoascus thermophilus]
MLFSDEGTGTLVATGGLYGEPLPKARHCDSRTRLGNLAKACFENFRSSPSQPPTASPGPSSAASPGSGQSKGLARGTSRLHDVEQSTGIFPAWDHSPQSGPILKIRPYGKKVNWYWYR